MIDQSGSYTYVLVLQLLPLLSSCRIGEPVGEGNFSTVYVGTWHSPKGSQKVAVKRLKDTSYHDVIVNILQEAAIMGQLRHNNVVKLVGIHVGFEGAPVSTPFIVEMLKPLNVMSNVCTMLTSALLFLWQFRPYLWSYCPTAISRTT